MEATETNTSTTQAEGQHSNGGQPPNVASHPKANGRQTFSFRLPPGVHRMLGELMQHKRAVLEAQGLGAFANVTMTSIIEDAIRTEHQALRNPLACSPTQVVAAEPAAPEAKKTPPREAKVADADPSNRELHKRFMAALEAGKTNAQIADASDIDRGAISTFKTKVKLWPAACAKLDAALTKLGY